MHSNSSEEVLAILVNDESWKIRVEVARNPNVTKAIIEKLAEDEDVHVKVVATEKLKSLKAN